MGFSFPLLARSVSCPLSPAPSSFPPHVMPPDLLPDPALGSVVRPMILQFFVLAVLWVHLVAPRIRARTGTGARGAFGARARSAPGIGRDSGAGSDGWSWILLPFLMISTGILFFSTPLQPVWGPLLGPGGERIPAIPSGVARLAVLALNLGVVGWCMGQTGGVRRSPLLPLLVALPLAAWLVGGGPGGPWILGGGAVAVVVAAFATRERAREDASQDLLAWVVGLGGVLVVLGLAAWLGSGGSEASPAGTADLVRSVLGAAAPDPVHLEGVRLP